MIVKILEDILSLHDLVFNIVVTYVLLSPSL